MTALAEKNAYERARRAADPAQKERHREYMRAYRAANPEKVSAWDSASKAFNSEKVRARHSAFYLKNKEKIAAYAAAWGKANPEKRKIHRANRRARKIEGGGQITRGLGERLYSLQRGLCACCGQSLGRDYQLDHIMPLARGGDNTDGNIQLLLAGCNNLKRAKHPIDFMQKVRGKLL